MSPNRDDLADELRAAGRPEAEVHEKVRTKAVAEMQAMTQIQKLHPEMSSDGLVAMVAAQLPEGYDVDRHFTPRHMPSEQRVCRILDGDLFAKIREGKVTMVTDEVDHFTEQGIVTRDGDVIEADVVITATGFELSVLGDLAFDLDGEPVDFSETVTYRGIMFTGVPNMAWTFGALRLSWTMRAEMVNRFVLRMLAEMEESGATVVVPELRPQDAGMELTDFVPGEEFNPGYLQRARHLMPRSGDKVEWQLSLDYWSEAELLPTAELRDGCLRYS
jgi:cation diffusion facilitator CzcD-associated flavoprotein CzcO